MANGKTVTAALRIKPAPEAGVPTITLTGPDHRAFKDMLGHECKVGDKYTLEVTATEVTPESIVFSLDSAESEYEEGEEGAAEAPAPVEGEAAPARSAAMTYA